MSALLLPWEVIVRTLVRIPRSVQQVNREWSPSWRANPLRSRAASTSRRFKGTIEDQIDYGSAHAAFWHPMTYAQDLLPRSPPRVGGARLLAHLPVLRGSLAAQRSLGAVAEPVARLRADLAQRHRVYRRRRPVPAPYQPEHRQRQREVRTAKRPSSFAIVLPRRGLQWRRLWKGLARVPTRLPRLPRVAPLRIGDTLSQRRKLAGRRDAARADAARKSTVFKNP